MPVGEVEWQTTSGGKKRCDHKEQLKTGGVLPSLCTFRTSEKLLSLERGQFLTEEGTGDFEMGSGLWSRIEEGGIVA